MQKTAELFARQCDVTGQLMNSGWYWESNSFYTATREATLKELESHKSDIAKEVAQNGSNEFSDELDEDEFAEARNLVTVIRSNGANSITDDEWMLLAYALGYFYYTEWEDDDFQFAKIGDKVYAIEEV